ncbi:MAG TPA: VOC family protein [Solirubrobacteraceae bacterium]|nr:VOC family protein [Solirubrobacteraceae bacterium]
MSGIDPALRIRSVTLGVSDVSRSADFYEHALGLPLITRENGTAVLGADPGRPALVLRQLAQPAPLSPGASGLYHVAWLHPSRAALADTLRRLARARWPLEGASDHGVSEAVYLSDPDGLGIEIYADRPSERWARTPAGGIEMVTLPLDLEDLLAQSASEPPVTIEPGTGVGHVHLKVSDVARASRFYDHDVGLDEQARLPSASFLGAGGYHHHVGLNSWQSMGAPRAPDTAPGLLEVLFELSGERALTEVERRLAERGDEPREHEGRLLVLDPDGQTLAFAAPGS